MIYDRFYVDNPPTDIDEAMKLHDDLWNAAIDASLKNGGTLNEHHGVGLKLGRFMKAQHGSSWEFMLSLKKSVGSKRHHEPRKTWVWSSGFCVINNKV